MFRDRQRPATRGKRQIHGGRLAVRFGVWLVKVGVAIEKKKAVTAATPEREEAPQNDRTIASKYDGQHRPVQQSTNGVSERDSVVG